MMNIYLPVQAFGVADGVILPRFECLSVDGSLEDPIGGTGRVGSFEHNVSHLVHLRIISTSRNTTQNMI